MKRRGWIWVGCLVMACGGSQTAPPPAVAETDPAAEPLPEPSSAAPQEVQPAADSTPEAAPATSSAPSTSSALPVPPGWQRVTDPDLGCSMILPDGAAIDSASERRTWRGEEGKVTYLVTLLPPPPAELTESALARVVMDYLGPRCTNALRVHGRFESNGVVGMEYEAKCKDGTAWQGMLRVRGGQSLAISAHAPAGMRLHLGPYFDNFSYTKR